jgi:hypothetical protein
MWKILKLHYKNNYMDKEFSKKEVGVGKNMHG